MRDAANEAFGASGMGDSEDELAIITALLGTSVVDVVGRVEADAAVIVLAVVPGEEIDAVRTRVLDAAEALGEVRAVLEAIQPTFLPSAAPT